MPDPIAAIDAQIEAAQKRIAQLKAKRERIELRELRALTRKERATETRKKILLGAAVLSLLRDPANSNAPTLAAQLKARLTAKDQEFLSDLWSELSSLGPTRSGSQVSERS